MIYLKKYCPLPSIITYNDALARYQQYEGITGSFIGDLFWCLNETQTEELFRNKLKLSDAIHLNHFTYFAYEPKKYIMNSIDANSNNGSSNGKHLVQKSKLPIQYTPLNQRFLSFNNSTIYYPNEYKDEWTEVKKDFTLYPYDNENIPIQITDYSASSIVNTEICNPEMTRQSKLITDLISSPSYCLPNQDGFYDLVQYIDIKLPSLKRVEVIKDGDNIQQNIFYVERTPVRRVKIRVIFDFMIKTASSTSYFALDNLESKMEFYKLYKNNMKYSVLIDGNDWALISKDVKDSSVTEEEADKITFEYHKSLNKIGFTDNKAEVIINNINKAESVMNEEIKENVEENKQTLEEIKASIQVAESNKNENIDNKEIVGSEVYGNIDLQIKELNDAGMTHAQIAKTLKIHHTKVRHSINKTTKSDETTK